MNTALACPIVTKSLCNSRLPDARIRTEGRMTIRWRPVLGIVLCSQLVLAASTPPTKHNSIYDYSLVGLDGKDFSLSAYKGKVLLIVNLASQSIYKSQISSLEALQKTYADKGLQLVGIPSSDFGAQELTDNAAIQHYYLETEHITFPIFSKASLRGKDAIPLIHFLTDPKEGAAGGDLHWNFTKFLVDRQGHPVLRFEADSDPNDPEFRVKLEQILDGTYKKKEPSGKEDSTPPSDDDDDDGG
jgi:glutathione peroxidase